MAQTKTQYTRDDLPSLRSIRTILRNPWFATFCIISYIIQKISLQNNLFVVSFLYMFKFCPNCFDANWNIEMVATYAAFLHHSKEAEWTELERIFANLLEEHYIFTLPWISKRFRTRYTGLSFPTIFVCAPPLFNPATILYRTHNFDQTSHSCNVTVMSFLSFLWCHSWANQLIGDKEPKFP